MFHSKNTIIKTNTGLEKYKGEYIETESLFWGERSLNTITKCWKQ